MTNEERRLHNIDLKRYNDKLGETLLSQAVQTLKKENERLYDLLQRVVNDQHWENDIGLLEEIKTVLDSEKIRRANGKVN